MRLSGGGGGAASPEFRPRRAAPLPPAQLKLTTRGTQGSLGSAERRASLVEAKPRGVPRSPRTMQRPLSSSRLPASSLSTAWQPLELALEELPTSMPRDHLTAVAPLPPEGPTAAVVTGDSDKDVSTAASADDTSEDDFSRAASIAASGVQLFRAASSGGDSKEWNLLREASETSSQRPVIPARPKNQAAHFLHRTSARDAVRAKRLSDQVEDRVPALPKRPSYRSSEFAERGASTRNNTSSVSNRSSQSSQNAVAFMQSSTAKIASAQHFQRRPRPSLAASSAPSPSASSATVRREIVLRLQIRLSSRLSNVVAVVSERRACVARQYAESLRRREWKKCVDMYEKTAGVSESTPPNKGGPRRSTDTKGANEIWKETGRTELLEDVLPNQQTAWLIGFCADIVLVRDDMTGQYMSLPENERRVAIYHVPHVGLDCHNVDNFVPVGYAIIDLLSLLPLLSKDDVENDEYWGIATPTLGMSRSESLQPFQHMSIYEGLEIGDEPADATTSRKHRRVGRGGRSGRSGTSTTDILQLNLNKFVDELSRGIPAIKLPKGKKCMVRIANDGTSIVIDKSYRKKDKPLPLKGVRSVQLVSELSIEDRNQMSRKKKIPLLTTLAQARRTVHFLYKKDRKKSRLVHYLVQFKDAATAQSFIHGMLLLLKTRTVKISATVVVEAIPVRAGRVTTGFGQGSFWNPRPTYPRVDVCTLTFQNSGNGPKSVASSRKGIAAVSDATRSPVTVVHERIEESVFADHAPAAFLVGIVAVDLQRRMETLTKILRKNNDSGTVGSSGDSYSSDFRGPHKHSGSRGSGTNGGDEGGGGGFIPNIREGFTHVGDGIRGGVIHVGESVVSLGRSAYRGVRSSVTEAHSGDESQRELSRLQKLQQELLIDELRELSVRNDEDVSRGHNGWSKDNKTLQGHRSLTFRASSAKKKHSRRFMPLNCHTHQVQLGDGSLCAVVTSGAHCAHSLGFKHGGLLPLLEKHAKSAGRNAPPPVSLYHRLACCVSQSLTTMLTALAFDLANKAQDVRYWNLLRTCGYLCHFECLLSTAGDENGMLDDHIVAIETLKQVTVEVCYSGAGEKDGPSSSYGGRARPKSPRVVSMSGSLLSKMVVRMDLGVPIAALGIDEKETISIDIFPVLVTQGINEQQTIANAVGSAGRQNDINQHALRRLGQ